MSLSLFLTLVVLSSESRPTPTDEEDEVEYTSMWVVRVSEPEFAEKIAAESGYRIKKMVSKLEGNKLVKRRLVKLVFSWTTFPTRFCSRKKITIELGESLWN